MSTAGVPCLYRERMRGDTFSYTLEVFDESGALADLTGYTVLAHLRATADGSLVATPTVSIMDQTLNRGKVSFLVTAAQSGALTGGSEYVSDVQATSPTGVVSTVYSLTFLIVADVTHA